MSAVPAHSLPAPKRTAAKPRRLWSVPVRSAARAKPKLGYAIAAVGGVALIVVAQLILSVALTQGAYEIDRYELRQAELALQQQKLSEDLDRVESPQFLAMNAEALGMVPNTSPVYLRLSDGAVLGQPAPAGGGAAASAPLVPNMLLDGVPLVTERAAEETARGAAGRAVDSAAPPETVPAPPTADGGLPTPATH